MNNKIEHTLCSFYGVKECTIHEVDDSTLYVKCVGDISDYIAIALQEICNVPSDQIKVNVIDETHSTFTVYLRKD